MTIPMSLGGFPSVSVPIHGSIPNTEQHSGANDQVGLQLFGPRGSEELVLKAARTLEFA
jgi:Asp-tRNA(Asn)/Glu-tRNA(Gln) amidotransferase A subunit family amidase